MLCIIGLFIHVTEESKFHVTMVNTTEVVDSSSRSTDTICIVIFVFILVVHTVIIYAISKRNRLAKKRYYNSTSYYVVSFLSQSVFLYQHLTAVGA